jgi:Putative zinc-finger
MTNPFPGLPGPMPGPAGHADGDVLASYAAGTADGILAWSVEAHLAACPRCRSALLAHVDGDRLARNRSVMLALAAIPEGGPARRWLGRCGVPDHLLSLLAATPSLRRSWLLSVVTALAVVAGEAALVRYGWTGAGGHPSQQTLAPFLLVAPLLTLAGVAAAFLPAFDPASLLANAAPFSGFTLLLVRAVSALVAALIPVTCAAFVIPGPGWLPAALLLPSLALSAMALAAATVMRPYFAAIVAGALWALPLLLLAMTHLPMLRIVQWHGQAAWAAVLLAAIAVLLLRRERFEFGWMR